MNEVTMEQVLEFLGKMSPHELSRDHVVELRNLCTNMLVSMHGAGWCNTCEFEGFDGDPHTCMKGLNAPQIYEDGTMQTCLDWESVFAYDEEEEMRFLRDNL